ncbi:MAG: hypothetical protein ABW019_02840 [Chitinophagaceae bacterium]
MKYFLLTITLFALACNNQPAPQQTAPPDTPAPGTALQPEPAATISPCYVGYSGRDTVRLTLSMNGDQVTGTLHYDFFEKDRNHGSISGHLHGDTLIADYIYTSEGMSSVREVAFLKQGNTLSEGYGPTEKRGSKTAFHNPAALHYGQGFVLQPTDCP